MIGQIRMINADCVDVLKSMPDKCFDLAIVDPPYGLGEGGKDKNRRRQGEVKRTAYKDGSQWDNSIPNKEYFEELYRISKNQIIFGANYMTEFIPPSMGWIVWDKGIAGDFSDCELAYSSFKRALRKVYVHYMADYNGKWEQKIHPCQKPIGLYRWILENYANAGDKIIDTHFGSGSLGIACDDLGFELTAIERDPDYFKATKNRIIEYRRQLKLF